MNVYDFARRYLYPYRIKGSEIKAQYCPFCRGGEHRDKQSFSLNIENKTFNCKRGSCGKSGTFKQLCEEFGEVADVENNRFEQFKREKKYEKPKTKTTDLTKSAYEYLQLRKISRETIDKTGVLSDEKGNIVFRFLDEKGEYVFTKFRPSQKVEKGQMKSWREANTKPILYLMNLCKPDLPLCLCEGEIDCLSLYESGIENAVSVPSGCEDMEWIETCWNWLEKFKKIVLFGDNDDPGREMTQKLVKRLGAYRCWTIPSESYKNCKDVNEILYRYGKDAIREAIAAAQAVPIAGLLNLADIKPLDIKNMPKALSGISVLDSAIGGFLLGELSIWTGKRGNGKSTLLGQILLESINQGIPVAAYSGELPAAHFQYWINLQAAGEGYIKNYHDPMRGKDIYYLEQSVLEKIKAWYDGKFFLYDNTVDGSPEETSILKVFEYAVRRYDCKVFLVDNLMTARTDSLTERDFYHQQSKFVGELVSFAKSFGVHIHLVAHPKKTPGKLENDDVSGSGDVTNRADNVFSLERVAPEKGKPYDTVLKTLKNRFFGSNKEVGLKYSKISRRLYLPNDGENKMFGWNDLDYDPTKIIDENYPDLPF